MENNTPDLIPIKSITRTIQSCFQQCLYEVPNFQRPYSWGDPELADYWDDVIQAQGDFFFGSTVTWVSRSRELFNDTYSIIDGQQRLTTSAIALSVIRDLLRKVAKAPESDVDTQRSAQKQAEATQKYLMAADDDGVEYPVIKRTEAMFYEVVQNPSAIPSNATWNQSAERIGRARRFFEQKILDSIEEKSTSNQIDCLKDIRSNILKARVIQVELASEEDGFLVFETLNTRGSELKLSHLVKNLLIRGATTDSTDRQTIADRWDTLSARVQEGRSNADAMDRFIWQSWNSRRPAVKEPELFKRISNLVSSSPSDHLSYLEELEVDSYCYAHLELENLQPELSSSANRNAFAIADFTDSVRALALFNVSVANSTIMAVVRKFKDTRVIKSSQVVDVLKMVESFHFQFNALTSSGSTGGTRGRYNRFAVRLESARTRNDVNEAIEDLRSKLSASLPPAPAATLAFSKLFYAPRLHLTQVQKPKARKPFISYIFLTFGKYAKNIPAGQDLYAWSIEHIKPQELADSDYRNPIYSIGNLTALTSSLNTEISNSITSEKLPSIRSGCDFYDEKLQLWESTGIDYPDDNQIKERADYLATLAVSKVWAI